MRRLGRPTAHRMAMLRNMAGSLIMHESITTTQAKALELKSFVEKLVTLGKKGQLHHRRSALSTL